MRILLWVFVPPILLLACGLFLLWLPLPRPFPPALSHGRNRATAILTGVLGIGYLVGLTIYVISSVMQPGRALDPILTPLGLSAQSYALFGKRYQGQVDGRSVDVTFMPGVMLAPMQLDITVAADFGSEAAIGLGIQRPLLDCRDCPQVALQEPTLDHLQVYARDEAHMRNLLTDPANAAAVNRLLDGQQRATISLYLQPEQVWLRVRTRQMSEGQISRWLEDLLYIAQGIE